MFRHIDNSNKCLSSLDKQTQIVEEFCLAKQVYKHIETDLEEIFKKTFIAHFPQANFQYIALGRLSGKSWQDISLELGIPTKDLGSFFQNCCQKFAVKLKQNIKVSSVSKYSLPWWVKITTKIPFCIYYFGPFDRKKEASLAKYGYIEDLIAERSWGITVEVEQSKPKSLTIFVD